MSPAATQSHIYMDHSATTPVHEEVIAAMLPYWTQAYGNPASGHTHGRMAQDGLSHARRTLATLLNARPSDIVFTGCGSESDNLAVRGVLHHAGPGAHLITSVIEHKAVLDTAVQLRDHFGFSVTILPVDEYGQVAVADVAAAIRPETALISIMAASNEIGTIQPFLEIGALARRHNILFHTDAVQLAGFQQWDLQAMPIDLLSMAPHKFGGPKGVGILYVRRGVTLFPALTGGGQEEGRRPGTVNVAFAVGAATAFKLAMNQCAAHVRHCLELRDLLIERLLTALPNDTVRLTGHPRERLPHHASFAFRDISGNDLLINLDLAGVSGSSGSACATGNPKPSPTLAALGMGPEWTTGGLRLTVGEQNSVADAEAAVDIVVAAVGKLQTFARQTFAG